MPKTLCSATRKCSRRTRTKRSSLSWILRRSRKLATAFRELHAALGRPRESEESYRGAIAVGTEACNAAHVRVLRVRTGLAKVLASGQPVLVRREIEGVLEVAGQNEAVATEAHELLDGIRE